MVGMFFDTSTPERRKRAISAGKLSREKLEASPVPPAKAYSFLSEFELVNSSLTLAYDVESYPNYFIVSFYDLTTGRVVSFEAYGRQKTLRPDQRQKLAFIAHRHTLIGFNSNSYDEAMLAAALQGNTVEDLKRLSNDLINVGYAYRVKKDWGLPHLQINHIDLIEVAPLEASLKLYGARLHAERLQDLPYHHESELTEEQAANVKDYNVNDLELTAMLAGHLEEQIKLRERLSADYGIDLRSKSDAQIAEAAIVSELRKLGIKVSKPTIEEGFNFAYDVPDYLHFKNPSFAAALEAVRNNRFEVNPDTLRVKWPDWLSKVKLELNGKGYVMGLGGLHSEEEKEGHVATEAMALIDRDVASYYPAITLNQRLYPEHLGPKYLEVYKKFVDRRLAAKAAAKHYKAIGDAVKLNEAQVESDSIKITINGAFGKLGDPTSVLYSPKLLIQITLTGQLSLLMLIEWLVAAGFEVVSANTDGVVTKCPTDRVKELEAIVKAWEVATGFDTEEARYLSLWSANVNNYIAVKQKCTKAADGSDLWLMESDGLKLKGQFAEVGSALNSPLSKNPEAYICSLAVQQFLEKGVPVRETIMNAGANCKSKHYPTPISRFVCVKRVQGGAQKDGYYLGKVVRWYYAKDEREGIYSVLHGSQVGRSEGARPLMNLTDGLPADLDFEKYVDKANEMLFDLGRFKHPATGRLF